MKTILKTSIAVIHVVLSIFAVHVVIIKSEFDYKRRPSKCCYIRSAQPITITFTNVQHLVNVLSNHWWHHNRLTFFYLKIRFRFIFIIKKKVHRTHSRNRGSNIYEEGS